jgi:hypothetical protein
LGASFLFAVTAKKAAVQTEAMNKVSFRLWFRFMILPPVPK